MTGYHDMMGSAIVVNGLERTRLLFIGAYFYLPDPVIIAARIFNLKTLICLMR